MARVTVMIPSYNYARYLRACVESAACQRDADVVIVDNGSTDDSGEIAAELADRHRNVRYVRHEDNGGIISSFNRCRAEVRCEYRVLLCADDLLAPGSLARSLDFMDAHPQVGLVYGAAIDFSDAADPRLRNLPDSVVGSTVHRGGDWITRLCATGRNPIRTPEAFVRTSVADAVGAYEPACPYTSDLNLWLRTAAYSEVAYLRGPVQAMFRRHGSNIGEKYPHNSAAEIEQRWAAFERFFATVTDDARVGDWEHRARRTVARDARYAASRVYPSSLAEAADLLTLADTIDPGGPPGSERVGWALRRGLGPSASRWFPGFQFRPVAHRLHSLGVDRRQRRIGVG